MKKIRIIAGAKVGYPKCLFIQVLGGENPLMGSLQIFLDDEIYVGEMAMAINEASVKYDSKKL